MKTRFAFLLAAFLPLCAAAQEQTDETPADLTISGAHVIRCVQVDEALLMLEEPAHYWSCNTECTRYESGYVACDSDFEGALIIDTCEESEELICGKHLDI